MAHSSSLSSTLMAKSLIIAARLSPHTLKGRFSEKAIQSPCKMSSALILGKSAGLSGMQPSSRKCRILTLRSWEHMKPLLRYYEYSQGVQMHVASFPSMFDSATESPVYSMTADASQAACQMTAMEGGTFVLLATSIISDANREKAGMANAPDGKVVSHCLCA